MYEGRGGVGGASLSSSVHNQQAELLFEEHGVLPHAKFRLTAGTQWFSA